MQIERVYELTETEEKEIVANFEFFENGIDHNPVEQFILATENGKIVGCAHFDNNILRELQVICEAPKGTGTAIVNELKDYCGDDGVQVDRAISEAVGFYEKMGFEKVKGDSFGQWDMIWWPG